MSRRHMTFTGFVFAALIAVSAATAAADFKEISTQSGGVTVRAKPAALAGDAKAWTFEIRLDTHSQDLSDDLVRASVLVDEAGKQYAALGWDGMPPGGHHRKGVLSFAPIKPPPVAIELQIQRAGEAAPRRFRWPLK